MSVNSPVSSAQDQAEAAVRTLLRWAGDDPDREGLRKTPMRVVEAFGEYFSGYAQDPAAVLASTYSDIDGYDDVVLLRGIPFTSHCEHHLSPFAGMAHVAYLPNRRIVGLSKLARVVEIFARRLQVQESMTAQIANCIQDNLEPSGVAVVLKAEHSCMAARGIQKPGVAVVTSRLLGAFRNNAATRREFFSMIEQES